MDTRFAAIDVNEHMKPNHAFDRTRRKRLAGQCER